MDFLPFEINLSPLDITKYGPVWEIPHYLTDKELEIQTEIADRHSPIDLEIYPNKTIQKSPSKKSLDIYEHYRNGNIPNYVRELFPLADYSCLNKVIAPDKYNSDMNIYENTCPVERVQGNPKGMKYYPPHPDGGKLITVLNPLCPVKSVPTTFNGYRAEHEPVDLGWEVNKAYMFVPSYNYSYHSYIGDNVTDRWVTNYNIMGTIKKQPDMEVWRNVPEWTSEKVVNKNWYYSPKDSRE
tara:strand:+ start:2601 stop:3320 length:720 start_codon:yes stop_codon:yes gene_type:complete